MPICKFSASFVVMVKYSSDRVSGGYILDIKTPAKKNSAAALTAARVYPALSPAFPQGNAFRAGVPYLFPQGKAFHAGILCLFPQAKAFHTGIPCLFPRPYAFACFHGGMLSAWVYPACSPARMPLLVSTRECFPRGYTLLVLPGEAFPHGYVLLFPLRVYICLLS